MSHDGNPRSIDSSSRMRGRTHSDNGRILDEPIAKGLYFAFRDHPKITETADGSLVYPFMAALEALESLDVPSEARPHRMPLGWFSHIGQRVMMAHDATLSQGASSDVSVIIPMTPTQLRAILRTNNHRWLKQVTPGGKVIPQDPEATIWRNTTRVIHDVSKGPV